MAKHEIMIHENTSATKESAPYLGTYVSKETIKTNAFATAVAEKCGLPSIQVQAVLTGSIDAIEAMEKEALVRVNLDGGAIAGIITGSFPTADAAFDPEKNALVLAFYLDDDVRLSLADVTPVIVTDTSLTKVRVDHVIDVAEPRPYEVIHGTHVFEVQGVNLEMADAGAGVVLVGTSGANFPCTVVESVSKQLIRVRTAALLEPGDYRLFVMSRGGDAEGPLQADYRKVKYLKVIDVPTITKIATPGKDGIVKGEAFDIEGTNLRYNTGDTVKVKWTTGTPGEQLLAPTAVTATKMSFTAVSGFDALPDNTELTFEVTIDETRVSAPTTVGA